MKKLLALLLAALLLFAAGCSAIENAARGALDSAVSEAVSGALSELDESFMYDEPYSAESAEEPSESLPESAEESSVSPKKREETPPPDAEAAAIDEAGAYTAKDDVALYIHTYGKLPGNFITKKAARSLGWEGGSLEPYSPGSCIGGDVFGNYEGLLPKAEGRVWYECDIDTLGAKSRGARRIVFSSDGLVYYTGDHYESFTELYGG